MSVINRIEIANYLNVSNMSPKVPDWQPGYIHNVLDCRGRSTAVIAANGTGKTTINRTIAYILTLKPQFKKTVNHFAAPKLGAYSHFRIEMLYGDPLAKDLLSKLGDDITGEPHVLGWYGFHDGKGVKQFSVYKYQGRLEDCPVASKADSITTVTENKRFLEELERMPGFARASSTEEWRTEVARHWDLSLLDNMVGYLQKGAGDSDQDFFKVRRRGPDGKNQDYDTAFFYEHLAPEIAKNLASTDQGPLEEVMFDATHDIFIAERKVKIRSSSLVNMTSIFDHLQKTNLELEAYRQVAIANRARASKLSDQISVVLEATLKCPIEGMPVALTNRSKETCFFANQAILINGHWVVPDRALAELTGSEPKIVNQWFKRKRLIGLNITQAIEIPCDLETGKVVFSGSGHSNQAYSIADCRSYLDSQSADTFVAGWTKESAIRGLNRGLDWRTTKGEANLFRSTAISIQSEVQQLDEQKGKLRQTERKALDLITRFQGEIKTLEVAEHAYQEVLASNDFSASEKSDLKGIHEKTEQELSEVRVKLRRLRKEFGDNAEGRSAWAWWETSGFGDPSPHHSLKRLDSERETASEAFATSNSNLTQLDIRHNELEVAEGELRVEKEAASLSHQSLLIQQASYEKFQELFGGEGPAGLVELLRQEQSQLRRQDLDLSTKKRDLEAEQAALEGLSPSFKAFQDKYPDGTEPINEKNRIISRSQKVGLRLSAIASLLPSKSKELSQLSTSQRAFESFEGSTGEKPYGGIWTDWLKQKHELKQELNSTRDMLGTAKADLETIEVFRDEYQDASPTEVLRALESERRELSVKIDRLQQEHIDKSRQLQDMESSGIAPGRYSHGVIEALGNPQKVYQVVKSVTEKGSPERESAMRYLSHVLHAPVASNEQQAKEYLKVLDTSKIDSAVFMKDALVQVIKKQSYEDIDGIVYGLFAGMETLQVSALLNPEKLAKLKSELRQWIEKTGSKISKLQTRYEDLQDDAALMSFVREAIAAEDRGKWKQVSALEKSLEDHSDRHTILADKLSDKNEKILAAAGLFLQEGEEKLTALKTEVSSLGDEKDALHREEEKLQSEQEEFPLFDRAQEFLDAGGCLKLEKIPHLILEATSLLEANSVALQLVDKKLGHSDLIQEAATFVSVGGNLAIDKALGILEQLKSKIASVVQQKTETTQKRTEERKRCDAAQNEKEQASKLWHQSEAPLKKAGHYLETGAKSFDEAYPQAEERLEEAENKSLRRTKFQLVHAEQGFHNHESGRHSDAIRSEMDAAQRDARQASEALQDLNDAQTRLEDKLTLVRNYEGQMDQAILGILEIFKFARRVASDQAIQLKTMNDLEDHIAVLARDYILGVRQEQIKSDPDGFLALLTDASESIRELDILEHKRSIEDGAREESRSWDRYVETIDKLLDDKNVNISDSWRGEFGEAQCKSGLQIIPQALRSYEQQVRKVGADLESAQKDLEKVREGLQGRIQIFLSQISRNFTLLKNSLKAASPEEGGFEIEAQLVKDNMLSTAILDVVDMIQRNQEANEKAKELNKGSSDEEFRSDITSKIRSEFFRKIFVGPKRKMEGPTPEFAPPRIHIRHPSFHNGNRFRFGRNKSTGQNNALGLMYIIKMAQYAIQRDAELKLSISGKRRKVTARTRVLLIDGLFSNLSDKKLIRESMYALRNLRGQFQLVGFIHNTSYENDPDLFPELIAIRKISNGFTMTEEMMSDGRRKDSVGLVELHVEPRETQPGGTNLSSELGSLTNGTQAGEGNLTDGGAGLGVGQ